ncbi:MAG TPA: sodium:solute symporter family protein [Methanomassiliicoccales archaeon]|nr:sodium:solute symporter family protein [Methanomassiliicoccales archaeon]
MVDINLIWGATILYAIVMVYLGYLGWKKTKSGEDFLLAGKKMHPWIIGLSYGSTFISTSAIVGFGGYAATFGMGIIWLAALNILVGVLIAFVFFGGRVREIGHRLKAQTFPEFLGKSYQSSFIRWFVALVILIGMPLYAAAVLIGGSVFMSTTIPGLDLNSALLIFAVVTALYVITGGLRAVMYTDALQAGLMIIGMLIILAITLTLVGGVTNANQTLGTLTPQIPSSLTAQGMTGFTSFPTLGSENWFALVATIILPVGIGVLAQPQLTVRFMTAKDTKSLNRAIPVGGMFLLMMTGFAFTIGAWSNVYFWNHYSKVAVTYVGGSKFIDNIIPTFINLSMDQTVVTLFLLTLLAAAMSTLSSLFHVMGSAAGYDLWSVLITKGRFKKYANSESSAKGSLLINRVATLLVIVVSLALALGLPKSGGFIAIATAMFFGICASAFLPLFVHVLFAKKPSKLAAELSLAVGTLVWVFWTLFVFAKDSAVYGISHALFGTDNIIGKPWSIIDPIMIALPLSTVTLIVVWFVMRNRKKEGVATPAQ